MPWFDYFVLKILIILGIVIFICLIGFVTVEIVEYRTKKHKLNLQKNVEVFSWVRNLTIVIVILLSLIAILIGALL